MIIKHQKGRGTKVHLLLDDEYVITTDQNFWIDNYIPDGTEIGQDEWDKLVVKINYKKALNKCDDFLSRRDYSTKELKTKLLKTVDEVSAQKAIDRYVEVGYLNDERYCEKLVKYLFETKKCSKLAVKQECFKRGVPSDLVNEEIAKYDDFDIVETIVDLINTKYSSKLQSENGKEKVFGALQRKGFSYGDIKSAFYRLDEEIDMDDYNE